MGASKLPRVVFLLTALVNGLLVAALSGTIGPLWNVDRRDALAPGASLELGGVALALGLLPGLVVRSQARKRGSWAWVSMAFGALGAACVAAALYNWLPGLRLEPVVFPVTRLLWNVLVSDLFTGLLFLFFVAIFTVTIDLLLMIPILLAESLLPLALLALGPTAGNLLGASFGALLLRFGVRRVDPPAPPYGAAPSYGAQPPT